MFTEDDLLPLSGLQHLVFCERQWALIHIEQVWSENRLTAEGCVLHERAHEGGAESLPGLRVARGLRLRSLRLGLSGQADVVEFLRADLGGVRTDGSAEVRQLFTDRAMHAAGRWRVATSDMKQLLNTLYVTRRAPTWRRRRDDAGARGGRIAAPRADTHAGEHCASGGCRAVRR
jgi:hypothetical protein